MPNTVTAAPIDLNGRSLYECSWAECPYPAKVIDLTAGGYYTVGQKVYHGSCYADGAAPAESASAKSKADAAAKADAALQAKLDAERAQAEHDAWVARRDAWLADPANEGQDFPEADPTA